MSKVSPYSIHADGYWDHMPPGHRIDVLMDDDGTRVLRSGDGSAPRAVGVRPSLRVCGTASAGRRRSAHP